MISRCLRSREIQPRACESIDNGTGLGGALTESARLRLDQRGYRETTLTGEIADVTRPRRHYKDIDYEERA